MTAHAPEPAAPDAAERQRVARRQLAFGWYALLGFATLGLVLEALHAYKLGLYLDVGSEMRRFLWRLAHAHGTFLALVNVAFALTLLRAQPQALRRIQVAAACLSSATLLLPLGFFLGGAWATDSDPGAGVVLVPPGALLLVAGLWCTARSLR